MKALLLFLATALLCIPTFAQAPATAKPVVKPAAPAFPRERFDPMRDAKADLDEAMARATKKHLNIILDVGGEWCSWCVHMDKFFYIHPDLTELRDDNFVWIKVNMSPQNENVAFLSSYPQAVGYPHLYVLDASGKLLHSQDTSELEDKKTYNLEKFTEFLKKWVPAKDKK